FSARASRSSLTASASRFFTVWLMMLPVECMVWYLLVNVSLKDTYVLRSSAILSPRMCMQLQRSEVRAQLQRRLPLDPQDVVQETGLLRFVQEAMLVLLALRHP